MQQKTNTTLWSNFPQLKINLKKSQVQCVWTCVCVSTHVYTCVDSYIYYLHNKRCSNWVIRYRIIWLIKITTQVPHRITHVSKAVVLLPLLLTIAGGNTYWRQIMCQMSICIGLLNSHKKLMSYMWLSMRERWGKGS